MPLTEAKTRKEIHTRKETQTRIEMIELEILMRMTMIRKEMTRFNTAISSTILADVTLKRDLEDHVVLLISWLQCVIMMDNVQGKNVCLGTPQKQRFF